MVFGPFALQWSRPTPNPPSSSPLPAGITRSSIHTPSGPLELLTALPNTPSDDSKPPLFFAHGGFGCAETWLNYMQYFATRGYPCYAMSYRGHGKSWYPSLWRMYFTTRHSIAEDLAAGVKYVEALESKRRGSEETTRVVLVAHSAGGALSQYTLSRKMIKVRAFCLFAGVPGFGSWGCYTFWALSAPLNFYYRAFHSRYLLATTEQIHDAFFTAETPVSHVQRFAPLLSPYESMLWPMQGLPAFITGPDVLSSITGWISQPSTSSTSGSRKTVRQSLFIVAAEKDVLCTPAIMEDAARRYQQALRKMVTTQQGREKTGLEVGPEGVEEGVGLRVVKGVAHHLQNHEEWERGAEEVREWVEQL